jgi:hypothetical protein
MKNPACPIWVNGNEDLSFSHRTNHILYGLHTAAEIISKVLILGNAAIPFIKMVDLEVQNSFIGRCEPRIFPDFRWNPNTRAASMG